MVFLLPISPRRTFRLPEFESGPNPISGTGLVPIGILVSSANTHRTQVTQGACLRAQRPSKSSVKHASHKAKAYRAGQSSETHIQRSLMGAEARKDAVPKTFLAKSRHTVLDERPASTFAPFVNTEGRLENRMI